MNFITMSHSYHQEKDICRTGFVFLNLSLTKQVKILLPFNGMTKAKYRNVTTVYHPVSSHLSVYFDFIFIIGLFSMKGIMHLIE